MMKWIKKIFDNSKHTKKQTPYRCHSKECPLFVFNTTFEEEKVNILSFTPLLTPSMHQSCTCSYYTPLVNRSRPPSPFELLRDSKKHSQRQQ